ncbi:hypothetical protein [Schlesneria paludicola]|uniref:hypothetical protein n=1 Tax=Schlesneria paludicola TaxID=360056 RepID=UPI000299D002|nr:hypothetical protein [Schlesneria paludicola]
MAASALSSDDTQGSGPLPVVGSSADVPEWLAARRRQRGETNATSTSQTVSSEKNATAPPLRPTKQAPSRSSAIATLGNLALASDADLAIEPNQHGLIRWITNETAIGVLVSLLVHTAVLLILAFILISNVTKHDGIALWGILGESQELGTDTVLDTLLPSEDGESPPIEIAAASQALESLGVGAPVTEQIRMGIGGKGNGEGDSGDGVSIGVASPRIPGYAQSKGHFSAWTEPRDPKPNENYFIVVQLRLPSKIKKYRGSDLTGMVNGTDTYKQVIRFRASEQFDIEEGAVEIRIAVPGGGVRVRDTIVVESKILHEKQTFEIEF